MMPSILRQAWVTGIMRSMHVCSHSYRKPRSHALMAASCCFYAVNAGKVTSQPPVSGSWQSCA